MSKTSFSDDAYNARSSDFKAKGKSAFVHDDDIKSGKVDAGVHPLLDPAKKNKAGIIIRESLDSDASPLSQAIAAIFDNTGSMQHNPKLFQEKLGKLIGLLVKKGIVPYPHVLFGAYNDATTPSKAPLQIGQYELGNEMDLALSHIFLEGGGGGHITESGELALYFLTRYSKMDCLDKRGQKGLLFLIGDELMYPVVNPEQVERIIGTSIEGPILVSHRDPRAKDYEGVAAGDLLAEAQEKFEIFWIMPSGSDHYNDPKVTKVLEAIFGQNYLRLEDPANICELIATTVGVYAGLDLHDVASGLKDIGADHAAVDAATGALTIYAKTRAVTKGATATGDLVETGSDDVARV